MSPKSSRHAAVPASSSNAYHGYRSSETRQPLSQSDLYFSSAIPDTDMMNTNYSLSSARGSRHSDTSSWSSTSGYVPRLDDYPLVSGYDSMSLSGTCFPMTMMPNSDAMDVAYDFADGDMLSRNAHLDAASQMSGLAGSNMMDAYPFMDLDQETAFIPANYFPTVGSGQWGPPTPPSDDEFEKHSNQGYPGRHSKYAPVKDESTMCEDLGPSKLQSYRLGSPICVGEGRLTPVIRSASRQIAQPRAIRPSSERSETHSTGHGSTDSRHSPNEDHLDKVKARNDPLYDRKPDKNGLYHCPFNKKADKCNHEPTKQKCIYS